MAAMSGPPPAEPRSSRALLGDANLRVIFAVTLMAVLGVSSITPAFPEIATELGVSATQIALLITIFTLPGVLLTPVLGILADRLGRKRVLVPSLLLFGVAGSACFLVREFHLLLVLRFVQGCGAAALGSINVTLIGDLFHGRERAAAMGLNASILSIGTASYPAIGGALAMLGWYVPFALPIAAVPIAVWVVLGLHPPPLSRGQRLSAYLGSVWRSVLTRHVLSLFAASTLTFVLLYGAYLTYFPFVMAHRFGASSLVIGLVMAVGSLTTAATASQLGRLVRRFTERTLIVAGFVLYAASLVLVPVLPSIPLLVPAVIVFGIAQAINIPATQTLLAAIAPIEQRAAFMSLNGMVLRLGQTLGPVLAAAAFGLGGLPAVFVAATVVALATAALLTYGLAGATAR